MDLKILFRKISIFHFTIIVGSLLEENSALYQIPLTRRREKQILVDSVKDTISNVVSKLDEYVEVDVNLNMGFFIGKLNLFITNLQ